MWVVFNFRFLTDSTDFLNMFLTDSTDFFNVFLTDGADSTDFKGGFSQMARIAQNCVWEAAYYNYL